MENAGGMLAILGVCVIVLIIGAMGRKVEWLVNFILRAVMGTVGIYWISGDCGTLWDSFFQNIVVFSQNCFFCKIDMDKVD